ncbi:Acetylserotonin O-methyltransferase [Acipenser ruthenus]|uniref:Acetylserotonin O-methyltransferase n=1 Tax=Acipenser ruthenus TaxID=7906 RepID=A0A662YV65_ACIRT|nr:Acetylserotonin O-methyltransferase [Acipenser ruthenus]
MNSSNDIEYPKKILDYMEGFLVSKTLFAACELGVFDFLLVSEQSTSSADIAKGLKTSVDGMERLLMACVGLQLLHADIQNGEGAEWRSLLLHSVVPYAYYDSLFEVTKILLNIPQDISNSESMRLRSDEEMITFMKLMNSVWNICGKDVVTAFDLSPFQSIYDLGGCSGAVAKQCVSAYPESMVTIFDLPKVVQMAKEHFVSLDERRISFHEGDFFRDPIPASDLYILARILHDWTDEKCLELLIKVNKACKPDIQGLVRSNKLIVVDYSQILNAHKHFLAFLEQLGGGLLLIEALLNEDKSGPLTTQLYSLNMLVQTEGRERSPSEYIHLMEAAGFTDIQVKRTGKLYDAVLGRK